MRVPYHGARRIAVLVVGGTLLLFGVVLFFLPGPGLLVVFLGLTVLASEFVWARLWLQRLRGATERAGERARRWRWWRRKDGHEDEREVESKDD